MLIVQVDFETAPANRAFALKTLAEECPLVRALPGNLSYVILTDPAHEGKVTLIHHWDNAGALAAYRTSDLLKSVGAVLFPLMTGTPSTLVWDATAVPAAA
jgi:quinol monooxygenase YgiN